MLLSHIKKENHTYIYVVGKDQPLLCIKNSLFLGHTVQELQVKGQGSNEFKISVAQPLSLENESKLTHNIMDVTILVLGLIV